MIRFPFFVLVALAINSCLTYGKQEAAEQASVERLIFDTEWRGERITLPPEFAPDMKLKGIEEIRFAPGMFEPDANSFFSYAFVFSLSNDQELTKKVIQREMLIYYRGLAKSVLGNRGEAVDFSRFTFELEQEKEAMDISKSMSNSGEVTQYKGELDWIEPFVTAKRQLLHFEIQAWANLKTARKYLFVCTSPKDPSGEKAPIWNELRKIRREFEVKTE